MAGMHAEINIYRPIDEVYGFFTDMERTIVDTDDVVQAVEKVTSGPFGPGARYVIRQPVLGRMREQTMTVLDVQPNERLEMEAAFGPVRPHFILRFMPLPSGTRVSFDGDSRPIGPFSLVPFLMDRVGERNWRRR